MTPAEIAATIAERDRSFNPLVEQVGPPPKRRRAPVGRRFAYVARSITFQLLATKAAATIHQRVVELCRGEVTAHAIIEAGHEQLRAVGLTTTKSAAMMDLAERTLDGRLQWARHTAMTDDLIVGDLVAVYGVGPWTAQMYLMHPLARHDVWPAGDFGVRHGWTLIHELHELVSERELRVLGQNFPGVRSDVAWYCWRAVELARAM